MPPRIRRLGAGYEMLLNADQMIVGQTIAAGSLLWFRSQPLGGSARL